MKTTETNDSRIAGLIDLFEMQTDFFYSVLDGISATDMHNRLDTKANHIAWLAGSLVQQRYELASRLTGQEYRQAAHDLFNHNQGIKEGVTYPSAEQYKEDWKEIAPVVHEGLITANTEKLNHLIEFPEMTFSFFELISFSIYREANHIGQIALWRRLLGYEPMKYM
jgi:hypothetical protein